MARRATRASTKPVRNIRVDFTDAGTAYFTPPEDEYFVKIVKVNKSVSSNDNDQLEIDFEILEGKHAGKTFRDWFSLVPQALWKLAGVLRSAGIDIPEEEVDLDFDEIEGSELKVMIEHREYNDRIKAGIADSSEPDDDPKRASGRKTKEPEPEPETRRSRRSREPEEEKPARRGRRAEKEEEPPARGRRGRAEKEEKPARGRKAKDEPEPITADEVTEMSEDDLESVIEKYDLDVELSDFKTLRKKCAAVIDALEEADMLES